MRFPIFVFVLSERAPKNGRRKSARILSAAIIAPERVSFMWKVLVRMSGMTLSYICQKAQMDKNARPVRIVRRLLSFMRSLLIRNVVFSNMSIIAALR